WCASGVALSARVRRIVCTLRRAFPLGDRLASLRLAPGALIASRHRDRLAESSALLIDRSERRRIQAGERVPAAEEARAHEELHHRVGEDHEDQDVDEGREAECEG